MIKICLTESQDLEWFKLDGKFSSSVKIVGNKLHIGSFNPSIDTGLYGCKVYNGQLMSESRIYLGSEEKNEADFSGNIHIKITKMPIGLGVEKTMELSCNPSKTIFFNCLSIFKYFIYYFIKLKIKIALRFMLNGVDQI